MHKYLESFNKKQYTQYGLTTGYIVSAEMLTELDKKITDLDEFCTKKYEEVGMLRGSNKTLIEKDHEKSKKIFDLEAEHMALKYENEQQKLELVKIKNRLAKLTGTHLDNTDRAIERIIDLLDREDVYTVQRVQKGDLAPGEGNALRNRVTVARGLLKELQSNAEAYDLYFALRNKKPDPPKEA